MSKDGNTSVCPGGERLKKHSSLLTHSSLFALLLAYFALAFLFAGATPAWQNPDEPAHYNYVAFIATERRLPVLQMGDYDEAYLQRLKDEQFPPGLSIAPVRYEFHQPPLYYLLAAPVYWLSGGSLLALRLFSALLGAGVLLLIFASARTLLPHRPGIALGATAFAAFLPMHLAILSAVNNDVLAELVIAAGVLVLLRWARIPEAEPRAAPLPHLLLLSLLIGLGFLTKATAYILLPVSLLVVTYAVTTHAVTTAPRSIYPSLLTHYSFLLTPALLLGLPLWLRNSLVYGGFDPLGLGRHDAVVTGQPTTAGWIAANGWAAYWERALSFTAKSFWGVFGWLGVFMDGRVYTLLFVVSACALLGLTLAYLSRRRRFVLDSAWLTLLLLALAALAAYVWYNLSFIQHQGRYLFPALPAWSLLFALGWWAVWRPAISRITGGALLLVAGAIAAWGLLAGPLDKWAVLLWGASGAALLLYGLLCVRFPRLVRLRPLLYALPFCLLAGLDAAIPFLYLLPQLM